MKASRLALLLMLGTAAATASAEQLVILHTNDTHSQIYPDDKDNLGGIARRKVLIDSIRGAEPHVLLVDAGDAVQGTLFFTLYAGEVEQKLMNYLGYDIRILGNHEFDNGVESLAEVLAASDAEKLATNYDLSGSALANLFNKYSIRKVGDKRVGFIAINLNPEGMIAEGNYDGVKYLDAIESANAAAWWLKNIEKVDAVVALTHIGYNPEKLPGDRELASKSRDIDVIIGGHSHDTLNPADEATVRIANADGRPVLVTQTGKAGRALGKVTIDFDNDSTGYELIRVDKRLDDRIDPKVDEIIKPYRAGVDSLMNVKVAKSAIELLNNEMPLLNFVSDFIYESGKEFYPDIDFAIINKGGLRRSLPKGNITEGQIISMLPFDNRVTVLEISGKDLRDNFDVMARTYGNGVSSQVDASFDPTTLKAGEITINGEPLDDNKTYHIATIDYLAKGGDYMKPLTNGRIIATSELPLNRALIKYLRDGKMKGRTIKPDGKMRMHPAK